MFERVITTSIAYRSPCMGYVWQVLNGRLSQRFLNPLLSSRQLFPPKFVQFTWCNFIRLGLPIFRGTDKYSVDWLVEEGKLYV